MEEYFGDYYLYSFGRPIDSKDYKYIGMYKNFHGERIDFSITRENKIKLSKISGKLDENDNPVLVELDKCEKRIFKQLIKNILEATEVHYGFKKPCSTQN